MEIKKKFSLIFAAILIGGLILLTVVLSVLTSDYLYGLHRNELREECHAATRAAVYLPARNFQSNLDTLAKGLKQDLRVRITYMDNTGRVLADSDVDFANIERVENHINRPEVQEAIKIGWGSSQRLSTTVDQRFLYVAIHLLEPQTDVSIVRVAMPINRLEETLADLRFLIIAGGIIMLLFTMSITWGVSNRIVKPLNSMSHTANRISGGDYTARAHVSGDDELGQLGQSLNKMAEKIEFDIKQMRKLERMRTEFIGNTSHELKTPIASIKGYIETLLSGGLEDPEVNKRFLKRALKSAVRLQLLVQDLIQISRIESGEMRMSIRYFNAAELLTDLHQEYSDQFQGSGLEWRLDIPENQEVKVQGDKERIKQVLTNLITNALKYTEEGYVLLGFQDHESRVRFYVRDTGTGVPQEYQSRIFERFFRIDQDRSRTVGGTGLGLAIVKHILSAHDTVIHVESDGKSGSVFWFELQK